MQISRHHVGPRMTQIVVHGGTIYLCGQTGSGRGRPPDPGHRSQNDTLLAEAGSSKSKLLQVQIWLADIRYCDEMNAVWDVWVDPTNRPGRATCDARMATPRVLVEIIVIAGR
jgi:enamine deaminase RidA (YjgF/YER057c/UK114 family)